jgi:hypothetical protein
MPSVLRLSVASLTAAAAALLTPIVAAGPLRVAAEPAPPSVAASIEHRYRIVGSVRLLFFWRSRDVGSGLMAWHEDGDNRSVSLLFGSDPARAPRGINEWGYLLEQVRSATDADAFVVQSATDPSFIGEPADAPTGGSGLRFLASCSATHDHSVSSVTAHVRVPADVTFRAFGAFMKEVGAASRWEGRRTELPVGAEPGFLTSLERVMRLSAGDPAAERFPTVSYVYRGRVYDLTARKVESIDSTEISGVPFTHLLRGSFAIRNRQSGSVSRFQVTFTPDGALAFVPIVMSYQPNWWLRVALELDESADVPADPAVDPGTLARIRQICGSIAPMEP